MAPPKLDARAPGARLAEAIKAAQASQEAAQLAAAELAARRQAQGGPGPVTAATGPARA